MNIAALGFRAIVRKERSKERFYYRSHHVARSWAETMPWSWYGGSGDGHSSAIGAKQYETDEW